MGSVWALGGAAAAQPEAEPNNNKAQANAVTLISGGSVSGVTTGSSTTTPGTDSADYFRIKTLPATPGVYRHTLTLTTLTPDHTATLRGLNQVEGVIGTLDVAIQTASTLTSPPQTVAWYGFGKQEEIYYRVTGTGATTGMYTATLTTTPVQIGIIPGAFSAGQITLTTQSMGAAAVDTVLCVYDNGFNAIPGLCNDDFMPGSGNARVVTTLASGTYYIPTGKKSMVNSFARPGPIELARSQPVPDFVNVLVDSAVGETPGATYVLGVAAANKTENCTIIIIPSDTGKTEWKCIVVESDKVCCISTSSCRLRPPTECVGGGGLTGEETVCTPDPCPVVGRCCVGSCCTINYQFECSAAGGTWMVGGSCSPNPCPAPVNDNCSNATNMVLGVSVNGDTCNATLEGGEGLPPCATVHGKSVWFRYTPSMGGAYRISACGSAFDTVLTVFTGPCGILDSFDCDDDACDGINPPGSGLASDIPAASLTAGTSYLIRVSSWGSSPTGGRFALRVSAVSGACCKGSTCMVTIQGACTGANTLYAGHNTACNLPGNNTTPCCKADFNHTGGLSVQDIFDFLAAYFAVNPAADFNGSGISVQDIFDFLAAYFGGCA